MIRIFIVCLFFSLVVGHTADKNDYMQNQYYNELDLINRYIKDNPWVLKYKNYNEYNVAYNEMIDIEKKTRISKKISIYKKNTK